MFIFNPVTLEFEWQPRGVCFANAAEADEDPGGEAPAPEPASAPASAPAPEPAPEPEPADDWRAGLPDDLMKTAERFTSQEDAVRAIVNFQKREGQVRVPGKEAGEDEISAYHKAIGVPESVDDYTFPELPEEQRTEEAEAAQKGWAEVFKANNVSKEQGEALAAAFYGAQEKGMEALNASDKVFAEQQEAALRQKWPGEEFERNQNLGNRALRTLAEKSGIPLDDLTQIETKDGRLLMDMAPMLEMFATVGREMDEGRMDGVPTETERETMDEQIETLRKQQNEETDPKRKNALYQKELALIERRDGDRQLVGAGGRVA